MQANNFADLMKARTKQLSIDIFKTSKKIKNNYPGQVLMKQIIRSATSVAANYRARSTAEFIAKLDLVEEEADETCFGWKW
jgi:four helix bundle protein